VITTTITVGWVVALIVVLIVRDSLPAGERWWVWTCVTGVVFGLFGLFYVPHLQRSRAEAAARRAALGQDPPENDSNTVSSSATPGRSTRS
jgi:H+/Cl- antiporter ClcA